jgi:hypothetical protein
MITFNNTDVVNFENAMRGARNPMNSWARMDSFYDDNGDFAFGPNDLDLAKRLCSAGSDDRKFIRQIFISVDITAPIYWWKEYDTYKVGTVANSTSTMHKIQAKEFELDDFSHDHMNPEALAALEETIKVLEKLRISYNEDRKNKELWYSMIQLLPESYHQMRTCTMSYENAAAMFRARHGHKLKEWHTFCKWVTELPYMTELFPQMQGYEAESGLHYDK